MLCYCFLSGNDYFISENVQKQVTDKKKTDAKRRCALHPEKSNKDLLNKAFYHVFLISITIIIITIIKSRIGIYLIFRNREQ